MVACLERTEGNADFHQIVDFLNASTIRYSLTISPTIYASYIEQFWATAKSKIVNNETQIHAKVDGKTIVISESSVRSNLHFNDEDGVTSLTNFEILENLALIGYEIVFDKLTFQKAFFSPQWKYLIHTILHCLSSKSTAWNEFSTNIASAVICLANNQKFNFSKLIFDGMLRNLDPNSKKFLMYPRFLQLFLNNQVKNLAEPFNDTYETPKHTQKVFANMRRKGKSFSGTVTPLFQSMLAIQAVEGEGSGQPSEPQPTPSPAPSSHEEQIPAVATSHPQKTQTPRQAKRGGHTPGSDEGFSDQQVEKESQKIGKEAKGKNSRDETLQDWYLQEKEFGQGEFSAASASVTTAGVSISTTEPRTPPTTTTTAFEDKDLTIAQTLVKMRSQKDKEKRKGVAFRAAQEESARPTRILPTIDPKDKGKGIRQEPEKPPKNPIKAQIQRDAEIAQILFEEEKAQFEREQRIARERAAK
ncbi:hypothetical protein Tco_0686479 [Tanacetum coccineum]